MIYAKTALTGYTKVEDVIEIMDESFLRKAIIPYGRYKSAEKQAEELIDLIEKKKRLIAFYSDITTAVHRLKAEHRRLITANYCLPPVNSPSRWKNSVTTKRDTKV